MVVPSRPFRRNHMSRALYVALITPAILSSAAAGAIAGTGKLQPSAHYALASAPPHRRCVYLADKDLKTDSDRRAALAALEATYDPHAIQRRRLRRTRPGLFDETDLPVAARYRAAIQATGARIHV